MLPTSARTGGQSDVEAVDDDSILPDEPIPALSSKTPTASKVVSGWYFECYFDYI